MSIQADLQSALVAPAARAAVVESQGEKRVGELVGALAQRRVFSRKELAGQWRQNGDFLRPQLTAWLRKVSSIHP